MDNPELFNLNQRACLRCCKCFGTEIDKHPTDLSTSQPVPGANPRWPWLDERSRCATPQDIRVFCDVAKEIKFGRRVKWNELQHNIGPKTGCDSGTQAWRLSVESRELLQRILTAAIILLQGSPLPSPCFVAIGPALPSARAPTQVKTYQLFYKSLADYFVVVWFRSSRTGQFVFLDLGLQDFYAYRLTLLWAFQTFQTAWCSDAVAFTGWLGIRLALTQFSF